MSLGIIARIWRYPVKSLAPEPLQSATILPEGVVGDRTRALFVRSGHAREGKTYRGKENDRLHRIADEDAAIELASAAGVDVERRDGARYFDGAPLSLLFDRWLEDVTTHVGHPVEPLRFRPNFFVHSAPGFDIEETALVGRRLQLGDAIVRVRCPIERCVVVTYDPQGGESDPQVLRYLAQRRNAWMGVYCEVERPGDARVGDSVLPEGA